MTLDGWDEIVCHLETITGIHKSIKTWQRWSRTKDDPIPVFDMPGGGIGAEADKLEEWWQRRVLRCPNMTKTVP